MPQTYDPILSDLDLPRLRLNALTPPRLGTALILVPGQGDLVRVDPGKPVPGARTGHYRSALLIDIAEHNLDIPVQLPSLDSSYVFQAVIHCRCLVSAPEEVARRQLRDVGALIVTAAAPRLRAVSAAFDIVEGMEAEIKLAKVLREVVFDRALTVQGGYIELPIHADEAGAARGLREAARRERLVAVSAEPLRQAIASGIPGVLARHLAANPDDTAAAIEMMAGGALVEGEQMLKAISVLVGSTGKDGEAFETWDARKSLMERFVSRVSSGGFAGERSLTGASGRGTAGGASRVLGTARPRADPDSDPRRRAGGEDERTVIEGAVVDADDRAPRPSRVVLPRTDAPRPAAPGGGSPRPPARDPDSDDRG